VKTTATVCASVFFCTFGLIVWAQSNDAVAGLSTRTEKASWAERMALTVIEEHPEAWRMRKTDGRYRWAYTQGLVLFGMEKLYRETGDERYYHYIKAYVDHYVSSNGAIETFTIDEYNIDSINSGKLLFLLYEKSGDQRYLKALKTLRRQLDWHPRTTEGGFWHKLKYPWQIWLDGLYMAAPFYTQYEITFGNVERLDDVVKQFVLSESKTRDSKTGLLYHGWDESRVQRWANEDTGLSANFWSRSMGWYAMALVDTLDYFPNQRPDRQVLIDILKRLADALSRFQHASGLWHQVTDQPDRKGNYLEASASSMFVYSFAKAVRKGYLPADYKVVAEKGFQGLIDDLIKVNPEDGRLRLTQICRGAGLGGHPYRDGSFEYYVNTDIVTNDAHGTGAFILAAVEMGRSR
jgi:unsaturated rhamnogalacturonyl hydrolase